MNDDDAPSARTAASAASAATIYRVAEHARVSIATVSRVLQGSSIVTAATRDRVLEAIEALDYVPSGAARSLAVRRHGTYGLALPELSGPYYAELLMGFETRAAELGQSVMLVLGRSGDDRARQLRDLTTRVDAVALFGAEAPTDAGFGSRPVVVIAGSPGRGVETITAENRCSAVRLTTHLLEHGRRRLLFVGDVEAAVDIFERHEGFVAAHREMGLEPAPPVAAEPREDAGAAVAERILAGELTADALVCGNDELALAAMGRLVDGGVDVPDAIAVVGWDDVMTSRYVRPALTTVRQPVQELGALAAERLAHLLAGGSPREDPQVLPTEVVLRTSCGCPRALAGAGSALPH
jgi:LacI family transcriptional regulator